MLAAESVRAIALSICMSAAVTAAHAQNFPGCELPAGFERAEPPRPSVIGDDPIPSGPRLSVGSLRRGFDDGNPRSCSNVGVLTLMLDPRDVTETEVYSFDIASGRLPSGLLPGGYIESVELSEGQRGFRFYWLDLAPDATELAPLSAVIRISRTFYNGVPSEPMLLPIIDAGGAPASTSRLWNSTVVWIGVALVLLVFIGMRMKLFRRPGRRQDELAAIQARLRAIADEKRADEQRRDSGID